MYMYKHIYTYMNLHTTPTPVVAVARHHGPCGIWPSVPPAALSPGRKGAGAGTADEPAG